MKKLPIGAALAALAAAGCAALTPTTPEPPAPADRNELLGLAIPRYQLEPDYLVKYGLVAPTDNRQVFSSYGTVAGPIPGLTADQLAAFHRGGEFFSKVFTPVEGQGPLANSNSCGICHQAGGIGGAGHEVAIRMALVDKTDPNWMESAAGYYDMPELGGPVQQGEGGILEPLPDQGQVNGLVAKLAAEGKRVGSYVVTSLRTTPTIAGNGLLSAVPDATILAREALAKPFGIKGHANRLSGQLGDLSLDGRVGKLGHKAQLPDNQAFFADAAQQELGLSNVFNPYENALNLPAVRVANPEVLGDQVDDSEAFCAGMAPPRPAEADAAGQAAFTKAGCAVCHYPGYTTANSVGQLPPHLQPYFAALGRKPVPSYTDLLVHRMGRTLGDGFKQGTALGSEWRTAPLWGVRFKTGFLHDGRATTIPDAITMHKGPGSEANQVVDNYLGTNALPGAANLTATEREALVRFVRKL
jgi:CxxC motif-containing protein (DUF1111 family)